MALGIIHAQCWASDIVFSNLNCALTLPIGWTQFPVDHVNYQLLAKSPNGAKTVILKVARPPEGRRLEASNETREWLVSQGRLTAERPTAIAGYPGTELVGIVSLEGKSISTLYHFVAVEDKVYCINAMILEGDAASDLELRKCLDSFRFLHSAVAQPTLQRDAAFIVGEVLGVAMVISVFWIGISFVRRRVRPISVEFKHNKTQLGKLAPNTQFGKWAAAVSFIGWSLWFATSLIRMSRGTHLLLVDLEIKLVGIALSGILWRRTSPKTALVLFCLSLYTLWRYFLVFVVGKTVGFSGEPFSIALADWWRESTGDPGTALRTIFFGIFNLTSIPTWLFYTLLNFSAKSRQSSARTEPKTPSSVPAK